jgi:hypothetical protein
MFVDTGDSKVTSFKLPSMILEPHIWTLATVVFIGVDLNIYNSRGRKRIHTWTGLTATCSYLVDEKGYDFGAYDWPWTKTDNPQ